MRATVLALGDLGRSPRICLHARSLARDGFDVDLVGFDESPCWIVEDAPRARVRPLRNEGSSSRWMRGIRLSIRVARVLRSLERPDIVLVQTPPAVPSLALARRHARRHGARLVFDWHNLGFTLMSLRYGKNRAPTFSYRLLERSGASAAHGHLAVTPSLRDAVVRDLSVSEPVSVFADRPSELFSPATAETRPALRRELLARAGMESFASGLVIVSPTSFTLDEELGMILESANLLDTGAGSAIAFVVTGRGEGQASFKAQALARAPGRTRIATAWLSGRDYARLIPGADIGLSLHASSSGVDFPMKIHDLRGSGLPVLARSFSGIDSGFDRARDGHVFDDAESLARWVRTFEQEPSLLARSTGRAGATWEEAWRTDARAMILGRES
jgi:beta-1,4-mannosyltransferase